MSTGALFSERGWEELRMRIPLQQRMEAPNWFILQKADQFGIPYQIQKWNAALVRRIYARLEPWGA